LEFTRATGAAWRTSGATTGWASLGQTLDAHKTSRTAFVSYRLDSLVDGTVIATVRSYSKAPAKRRWMPRLLPY